MVGGLVNYSGVKEERQGCRGRTQIPVNQDAGKVVVERPRCSLEDTICQQRLR